MKKRTLYISLGLALATSIAIFSCKKQDISPETDKQLSSVNLRTSCEECATECTSVPDSVVFQSDTVEWTPGPTQPTGFQPIYFDFTTGQRSTSSGQISLNSSFNSYFKGEGCWKVGYLPTAYTCSDLSSLSCSTLRDSTKTTGICPSGLGYQTPGCVGWYSYPGTTQPATIRLVSVFCDTDSDGFWDTGEKGYAVCVKIESQSSGGPSLVNVWAKYTFKYKCCS